MTTKKSASKHSDDYTTKNAPLVHFAVYLSHLADVELGAFTANCGFPVNFNNDFDNIDTSGFQLTRGLLTTAVFQAYLTSDVANELIHVDIEMQGNLLRQMTRATAVG